MAVTRKASVSVSRPRRESIEHARKDHRGHLMKMISLRLPVELDARMDRGLAKRPGRMSRNSYIIEAIDNQLKTDRV